MGQPGSELVTKSVSIVNTPPFTISCTKIDGFRPGSRSFLDYDLCERLRELSLREIQKTSTYAIDMVRFPLEWGTAQDSAEYIIYKGAVPLKIWFCGEVQLNWLVTTDGDPKSSVSLRINMLRESDQVKLEEILFDMSYPKVDHEAHSREIHVKEKYTESTGDVVMVEAYIQRYRPSTKPTSAVTDENKAKPKWEQRPWDEWKVKFQLKKLYVLYVGDDSGDAPGDVPDEDEEI
ncbi:hypothetical protein NLI96_g376 [Meripilus lineatus]|uniref:Uncharacterized protein n=1 Tax=Meripilus lineatus TaxID=2056292 RepID=A0AAD5VCH1_9APHY|nr:hypothetical protein NLI96_g376 [Physisporinus lineatus]